MAHMNATFKTTRNYAGSYTVTMFANGEQVDQAEVYRSVDDPRYWRSTASDCFFGYKSEAVATTEMVMRESA